MKPPWWTWRAVKALAIGGLVGFSATSIWSYLAKLFPSSGEGFDEVCFCMKPEYAGGLVFAAITPLVFLYPLPKPSWYWALARGAAAAWAAYVAFFLQDVSQASLHIDLIWPLLVAMGFAWGFLASEPARAWLRPSEPRA